MLGAIGGGRGQGVNLLSCEAPAPFLDNRQEWKATPESVFCVCLIDREEEKRQLEIIGPSIMWGWWKTRLRRMCAPVC